MDQNQQPFGSPKRPSLSTEVTTRNSKKESMPGTSSSSKPNARKVSKSKYNELNEDFNHFGPKALELVPAIRNPTESNRNSSGSKTASQTQEVVPLDQNIVSLPEELVLEILKYIDDGLTLLVCRRVCQTWKNVVDGSSELMRRITFPIWSPVAFLHLPISAIAKSISFKSSHFDTIPSFKEFMDTMADKVERITFDFDMERIHRYEGQVSIFFKVLANCSNLKEVHVLDTQKRFFVSESFDQKFIMKSNQISTLSVNVCGLALTLVPQFKIFLFNLTNLSKLVLFKRQKKKELIWNRQGFNNLLKMILNVVIEYLNTFCKNLKELHINALESNDSEVQGLWIKLLLLAAKHGCNIIYSPWLDLNHLLKYEATPDLPMNSQLFTKITKGELKIRGSRLVNLERLDYCVNLRQLCLHIQTSFVTITEFRNWVLFPNLIKLELYGPSRLLPAQLEEVFSDGIASIKCLKICSDIFPSPLAFSRFAAYFPNLEKLCLTAVSFTNNNLLRYLANIKKLVELELQNLISIRDDAFTGEPDCIICPFAALVSLKRLELVGCHKLTDNCLANGIGKSKSLEKLHISNCQGFTHVGFQYMEDRTDRKIELDLKLANSYNRRRYSTPT